MAKDYVEQRDGGYWIAGKRITLASVVYEFRNGAAPESIMRSFPLLTLEEVYGAMTFYLSNQAEADAYLAGREAEFEEQRRRQREDDPEFFESSASRSISPSTARHVTRHENFRHHRRHRAGVHG
ncbi:MAG TPA: DUF433 domain-containing protein [Pyrinomonadaceae bacterium]|nr:DUF433 domain-containing protein [Pyrinomonadaceae bacterium]